MQNPHQPDLSLQRDDLPPHALPALLQSYTHHLKSAALFDAADFAPPPGVRITRCVCLGLGNFTRPFARLQSGDHAAALGPRNDAMLQLAALSVMLELLARTTAHPVEQVYCQDPHFTAAEKEFLQQGLGYGVVEDPEAFGLVDAATFLFAPVVGADVLVRAVERKSPALFVGNCVEWIIAAMSDFPVVEGGSGDEEKAVFCRFRDETVVREMRFCKKYWMGVDGSARVLLPKGKTDVGSEG